MNKREEILSAVQSVAADINPMPNARAVTPQGVTVDIGGINVRNNAPTRNDGPSCRLGCLLDTLDTVADCRYRSASCGSAVRHSPTRSLSGFAAPWRQTTV